MRQGGEGFRAVYSVVCYKCRKTADIDSKVVLPDEPVRKKFAALGWALGRKRDSDTCPSCMGVAKQRLAVKFNKPPKETQVLIKNQKKLSSQTRLPATLNELFKAAEPSNPIAPVPQPTPQSSQLDTVFNVILKGMEDIRAASDLQMEQTQDLGNRIDSLRNAFSSLADAVSILNERITKMTRPTEPARPVLDGSRMMFYSTSPSFLLNGVSTSFFKELFPQLDEVFFLFVRRNGKTILRLRDSFVNPYYTLQVRVNKNSTVTLTGYLPTELYDPKTVERGEKKSFFPLTYELVDGGIDVYLD